ncbi:hypothetical protein BOTCAL_0206g00140 [Botryotinia calthae]|uniref:Glucose-methanol-choline oxidoreductase N-terminal domain-containing protein n=1 Tax=Botryotinia calthae TaxID=38488 RepID=A0A4Y8D1F9_9HELO|nr:hypothetical protein BOTCAL_0206g00140 [Botryotinia calthae]
MHVLVLVAGNDHSSPPTITTPGLWPANMGAGNDWALLSVPQGLSSDPFSGDAVDGYINSMNIDTATKTRRHALSAYYAPIATRENLVVVTSALTRDSQSYTVVAKREVILAAGALQTPKLLELSGIGSMALLSDLGIPVLVDNENAGENLQDHLNCSGGYFSYAALGNFIPEAGSGYVIGKQNSSASSDTKDGAASPGNYLTFAWGGRTNHGAPSDITDLDAVKEYVKKAALSAWHPTSTRAMLPLEKGGVVSEKLIVYGTKNWMIVNASIFPLSTRGNCQTTVCAVAEKAADMIRGAHEIKT